MSLFGRPCRRSPPYYVRTVAQGLSGSVLRYGSGRVEGAEMMRSSMLIIVVNIHVDAHDVEHIRGGDIPKGKIKPRQKSRIWRF